MYMWAQHSVIRPAGEAWADTNGLTFGRDLG
jgi:hypothetical protein